MDRGEQPAPGLPGAVAAGAAALGIAVVAPGETRRVLLVEDDEDDAILVADLLEPWPEVQLDVARTLADARAVLARGGIDCVLLDLNLPDAVGLEALERLLPHDPHTAIVVLTGDADDRRGAAAVAAGAQDYLVKGSSDGRTLVRAVRYAVERRNNERWREELAIARVHEAENSRLQRGLLPAPILHRSDVGVATAYRPGRRSQLLGGDFYDVVETADGTVHAMVGDVCGHGPDEAALGVRLRIAWRTLVLAGTAPQDLFGILDGVLAHERENEDVFVTMAQVAVPPHAASVSIRLAGHPPPILLGAHGAALADAHAAGPALGLGLGATWRAGEVTLPGPCDLVLYTDGLYERVPAAEGAEGGLDGLVELFATWAADHPAVDDDALARLIDRVEERCGGVLSDDVALLTLRPRHA